MHSRGPELRRFEANLLRFTVADTLELNEELECQGHVTRLISPAGADQLTLIAFAERPADWETWACNSRGCPRFDADDGRLTRLLAMLKDTSKIAQASLLVISQE